MFVEILDEKEVAALDNLFNDTVYYLIKSGNEENVSLAKAKVSYLNNKKKEYTWLLRRAFGQHRQQMKINSIVHFE